MDTTCLGLPWTVYGILALAVAAIYLVVGLRPRRRRDASRPAWRAFVLRWFHAPIWVLLALSCFIRATLLPGGATAANVSALLALLLYLVFLGTLVADRQVGR